MDNYNVSPYRCKSLCPAPRSDHVRFWYLNDSALPFESMRAVLLTDMGGCRASRQGFASYAFHHYSQDYVVLSKMSFNIDI